MPPGTLTVLGALLDDASPLDDGDAPLMTLSPRSASTTRSRAAASILRPSGKRTSSVAFRISMTVLTTITSDRIGHWCYCYCYSRLYFVVSRRKPRVILGAEAPLALAEGDSATGARNRAGRDTGRPDAHRGNHHRHPGIRRPYRPLSTPLSRLACRCYRAAEILRSLVGERRLPRLPDGPARIVARPLLRKPSL